MKNKSYPEGHPVVINDDFYDDVFYYFGFVKCKILPPKNLYLPLLPMRYDEKLMFVPCNACAMTKNSDVCNHEDDERCLINTWTTPELEKAVELGYEIKKIYQVFHYYRNSNRLFKNYINMWLKEKQEASGWPSWCDSDDAKDHYINTYNDIEGVTLNKEKIEKNPGKRFIAKLMLNSFWGKMAQRPNMSQTSIITNYADYWKIINNDDFIIEGEEMPNDKTIIINYKYKDDTMARTGNTNVAIASFVTAYARLHLYECMSKVNDIGQDRLLYFDTDSIIFVKKPGDPEIATGDFLGDLTDEILGSYGPDAICKKFVSLGPKNYGLEIISNGQTHSLIKTKGIRKDGRCLDIINIQSMIEMVSDFSRGQPTEKLIKQWKIISNKYQHYVHSKDFLKIYRVVSDKRKVVGNDTYPYGYC